MSGLDGDLGTARGPVFLRALRAALARPPLWLIAWSVPLLLGLALVPPWMRWVQETVSHAYAPGEQLAAMDEVFRQDHARSLDALRAAGGGSAAVLAILAVLAGVFFAGGWLQVFLERTSGHSVRRFLWGGAKYFWRFLRVLVVTVVLLSLVSWVLHGWPWNTVLELLLGAPDMDGLEVVTSEWTAVWAGWIQDGLFALAFALILVWGDYTRTRLALHDGRSAVWAGLCTFFLILVHPVRTLRPHLFLFGLQLALVLGIGGWARSLSDGLGPESGWTDVLVLFVLGQVALLLQAIARGAGYAAAVQVSHALVPPLPRPDPWASRIGGPGGPQYPIDDTDDYNVSI